MQGVGDPHTPWPYPYAKLLDISRIFAHILKY